MTTTAALQAKCKTKALDMDELDYSMAMTLVHETMHFPEVLGLLLGSGKCV